MESAPVLFLLGIHWMQFPEPWKLEETGASYVESPAKNLGMEAKYVKGLSGMTGVAPAWKILEMIELAEEKRKMAPQDLSSRNERQG